jgi:hypothetical protein
MTVALFRRGPVHLVLTRREAKTKSKHLKLCCNDISDEVYRSVQSGGDFASQWLYPRRAERY